MWPQEMVQLTGLSHEHFVDIENLILETVSKQQKNLADAKSQEPPLTKIEAYTIKYDLKKLTDEKQRDISEKLGVRKFSFNRKSPQENSRQDKHIPIIVKITGDQDKELARKPNISTLRGGKQTELEDGQRNNS